MGKNNNFKLIGVLIAGILIGGATVVGANQAIQALQNTEIKVSLNGQVQTFKDETTGEVQYPITYHDRTYLPLRNVAQLAGLDVDYDNGTNTAVLKGNKKLEIYDGDYKLNEYLIFKDKYLLSFCKSYDNGGVESTLIITGNNIEEKRFDVSVYEIGYNGASSMQEIEERDNSQDGEFMYEIKDNKILLTKYVPDGTTTNGGLTNLVRVDYEIVEENGIFTENIISINMDDCRNTAATGYTNELLNYVKNNSDKVINNHTFFETDCIHSKEIGERSGYAEYYYFTKDHSYYWHVDSSVEDNENTKVIASYGRWKIENGELILNELAQEYRQILTANHEIRPVNNTFKKSISLVKENIDNGNGSTSNEYKIDDEIWYTNAKSCNKEDMNNDINNILDNLRT